MKVREIDRTIERIILTGYIVSTDYIEQTDPWLHESYLEASGAKTILRWCRSYFQEYNEAPKKYIMDLFIENEDGLGDDEAEFITNLLTRLSGEFERRSSDFNVQYHVDRTREFCRDKYLEHIQAQIGELRSQGRLEEAESCIKEFLPANTAMDDGCDPLEDEEGWTAAFSDEQNEILFELPGAWGEFMNSQLYRESFIAFLAPEKRGKSFILQELAMRALQAGKNVAVFESGDMTKPQRYKRLAQYLGGYPNHRDKPPGEIVPVRYPLDFEGNFEIRDLPNISKEVAEEERRKWKARRERRGGRLRMKFCLNGTLTFKEMERQLEIWQRKYAFVPDVIIDDYIDIHAPENPRLEIRHQETQKWRMARQFSQRYHVCFITATQADADSYDKERLTMKNFSESKSKNAEVTAMIAMNQTKEEKAMNILRLDALATRDGITPPEVKILQCLEIGKPYIRSEFSNKRGKGGAQMDEDNSKRDLVAIRLKQGMEVKNIAEEVGVTKQYVYQIKKKL
jgi:hypothetical protein